MWISKKKYKALEKRIADLEVLVQSQQEVIATHINNHETEAHELREIFNNIVKLAQTVTNQ